MTETIIKTKQELQIFFSFFNTEIFALDTETEEDKLIGISLSDGTNHCYIPRPNKELLNLIQDNLQGTKYGKGKIVIGHNLVYDMKVLKKEGLVFYNSEWFDTMIAAHLIDENDEKGLKYLIRKYFPNEEVTDYIDAISDGIDSEKFYKYALNDAKFTYMLAKMQKNLLTTNNLTGLFRKIEMPFLRAVQEMEETGVLIDTNTVNSTTIELKKALFDLQIQMLKLLNKKYTLQANLVTGDFEIQSEVNFNSSAQLIKILEELGIEITQKTKTGNKSVGKTTISQLKHEHEFIQLLDKYKIANKLLTAFFEPMKEYIARDGRIHPRFNSVGTVTGRLSCSNPNLQQLPKVNENFPVDTRKCFVSKPGYKMISCDYSQQELRIMAHLSKDKKLIDVILNDGDIHLINANNVFNLGIPEEKLYSTHPEYKTMKKEYAKYRDMGKIFSFGIAYGMGIHKLSRDFKVSLEEAQVLLDNFFKGFPRLKEAIEKTHNQAREKLYVTTLVGRKRHFTLNQWGKLDDKSLRQSFNFLIQSLGADIMRLACIRILNYSKLNKHKDVKIIMSIHDEVVVECKEEYAEEVKRDMVEMMSGVLNLVVPLKVEGSIGNSYSECK